MVKAQSTQSYIKDILLGQHKNKNQYQRERGEVYSWCTRAKISMEVRVLGL